MTHDYDHDEDIDYFDEGDDEPKATTEKITAACPFCGKSDCFVERKDFSSAYVFCNACAARGPVSEQESDWEEEPGGNAAIRAWNSRPVLGLQSFEMHHRSDEHLIQDTAIFSSNLDRLFVYVGISHDALGQQLSDKADGIVLSIGKSGKVNAIGIPLDLSIPSDVEKELGHILVHSGISGVTNSFSGKLFQVPVRRADAATLTISEAEHFHPSPQTHVRPEDACPSCGGSGRYDDAAIRAFDGATAWQPIETAPKDGRHVLLYCDYYGIGRCAWESWRSVWRSDDPNHGIGFPQPTHWMPLPDYPTGSVRAENARRAALATEGKS